MLPFLWFRVTAPPPQIRLFPKMQEPSLHSFSATGSKVNCYFKNDSNVHSCSHKEEFSVITAALSKRVWGWVCFIQGCGCIYYVISACWNSQESMQQRSITSLLVHLSVILYLYYPDVVCVNRIEKKAYRSLGTAKFCFTQGLIAEQC